MALAAALALAATGLLAACSPSDLMVDAQPPGTILFGRSVDTETFQLQGELGQALVGRDLAYRARLSRPAAGDVRVTLSVAGSDLVVEIVEARYDADYALHAGTIPGAALPAPGQLAVRLTDAAGSTLALGSIGLVVAGVPEPGRATDVSIVPDRGLG